LFNQTSSFRIKEEIKGSVANGILSITISLVSLVVCLTVYNKVSAMEARIKTMQVNVDQIAKSEGLPPHLVQNEVLQLVRNGKEVAAVKKAREVLGLSLLEAKQYVDALKE
jgi:ribosomal protein L7/L12